MTREHVKIRILQKDGTDAGDVEAEESAVGPQQMSGARLTRHAHARERMLAGECDIIFTQSLYQQIVDHVSSDTSVEQGGLLLGYVEQHPYQARPVVVVDRALEAKHTTADISHLTFTHETWAEFERQTDELRERGVKRARVGWYHSHPGHGIFLSNYDLNVCEDFRRPTHVALVVDPVNHDGGFFVRGEAGFRGDAPQGFWEWHDLSEKSVVRWKNISARRVEWEGAPLAQPPDSVAVRGAAVVRDSSGVNDAEPKVKSTEVEDEGPKIKSLVEDSATPSVEPNRHASVAQHRGKTVSEAPLWAAALTAVVLLSSVVTLGVFVARMNNELKSKAENGDLDAVNTQLEDLRREFDRARASAHQPNPENANAPTPAAHENSVKVEETQHEDAAELEPVSQRGVDKTNAANRRPERKAEGRVANRNTRGESNTSNRNGRGSDATNSAQPPATVKTQNTSPAPGPTPAPAPPPARSPTPADQKQ